MTTIIYYLYTNSLSEACNDIVSSSASQSFSGSSFVDCSLIIGPMSFRGLRNTTRRISVWTDGMCSRTTVDSPVTAFCFCLDWCKYHFRCLRVRSLSLIFPICKYKKNVSAQAWCNEIATPTQNKLLEWKVYPDEVWWFHLNESISRRSLVVPS